MGSQILVRSLECHKILDARILICILLITFSLGGCLTWNPPFERSECTSGACCDGAFFRPTSHVCSTETEYRCDGTGCGADAQERIVTQSCGGTSRLCDGAISNGSWSTVEACTTDQVCVTSSSEASCLDCEYGCEGGECVTCSMTSDGECPSSCDVASDVDCCEEAGQLFSYTDPHASTVWLTGDFLGWPGTIEAGAIVMISDGTGVWSVTVYLEPRVYEYKLIVDGHWWWDYDTTNPTKTPDGYGNYNSIHFACVPGCDEIESECIADSLNLDCPVCCDEAEDLDCCMASCTNIIENGICPDCCDHTNDRDCSL